MPIVPVVGFWSTDESLSQADLAAALGGASRRYPSVIVPEADKVAIGEALGVQIADGVRTGDAAAIRAGVKDGALGLMRASDLTPEVRALALDGEELVGNDRVKRASDWPLVITVQGPADQAWDQADDLDAGRGGRLVHGSGRVQQRREPEEGRGLPLRWWHRPRDRALLLRPVRRRAHGAQLQADRQPRRGTCALPRCRPGRRQLRRARSPTIPRSTCERPGLQQPARPAVDVHGRRHRLGHAGQQPHP